MGHGAPPASTLVMSRRLRCLMALVMCLLSHLEKKDEKKDVIDGVTNKAGLLAVTDRLHQVDVDLLGRRLSERRVPSGGLHG